MNGERTRLRRLTPVPLSLLTLLCFACSDIGDVASGGTSQPTLPGTSGDEQAELTTGEGSSGSGEGGGSDGTTTEANSTGDGSEEGHPDEHPGGVDGLDSSVLYDVMDEGIYPFKMGPSKWDKANLTWCLEQGTPDLPDQSVIAALQYAAKLWASVTLLTIEYTADCGNADIRVTFEMFPEDTHLWWNAAVGDHFYTRDPNGELAPEIGYVYHGVAFQMIGCDKPGTTPFYRWNSPEFTDHFYTTDPNGEAAPASGYVLEGISGCVATGPAADRTELHRWWNPAIGDHYYAPGTAQSFGNYNYEGVVGFVRPPRLAQAYYPQVGDIQFDEAFSWTTVAQPDYSLTVDLISVALHEFGHALGIAHSDDPDSVMWPSYSGSHRYLSAGDVAAIQELYGAPGNRVYRWNNTDFVDHFYTDDPAGAGAPANGYVLEGIVFHTLTCNTPGAAPFYQWWHAGATDHFYTTDPNGEAAPQIGYVLEGDIGCIATGETPGTAALHRWNNPPYGDHFYTVDPNGEAAAVNGYEYEGVVGYVLP